MEENTRLSTLIIVNVHGSHAGEYFCAAQLNDDIFNSTKATLIVNCKYIIMQSYRK